MHDRSIETVAIPPEQQALRDKCFHPWGTFVEFPLDDVETSISSRFEKIARMHPDRIAVKLGDQVATYAELNAMANRVAFSVIAARGDRPEPVGLLFTPGVSLMAAMLGALKAGKSMLSLNPLSPVARSLEILNDCQAELLLVDGGREAIAAELSENRRQILPYASTQDCEASDDPGLLIAPSTLALLSSTSGSSGKPKQVMQSHRNVLHNVMLRTNLFRICADDRIGLPRSVTSGAVANYFLAFLNGATLFPFDPAQEGTAPMPAWLAREKITFLSMSVPLFRHLPDNLGKENLSLRMVQFASQAVHRRDVQKFKACFAKQCLLINYFSSTETGPLAAFAIDPEVETSSDDVPIGFPLRDKEIFLFNSDGMPAGPGEIGEIVVRSRYLSPGYWREPELTAAKFINDPQDDGQRLYHTGDLAVRLLDGCLVYKGRKDFRVKIRGYGVEIVEVENALRGHPKIQETVVVTRKNDAQEDCLIAYIVTSDRARLSVGELRAFLNTKLPDYMVPVKFIPLELMPLTPNGKIDRQALPDPNQRRPDLHAPYVAPRTPLERELADIWSAVLAFDAVGVHDNFFDLGGHSLAAARAVTRVIETFQLELQVQALFDAPTVAQMAAVIEARQDSKMSNDTLNRMLTEIEAMPDEEAARLLADSGPPDERKRK